MDDKREVCPACKKRKVDAITYRGEMAEKLCATCWNRKYGTEMRFGRSLKGEGGIPWSL